MYSRIEDQCKEFAKASESHDSSRKHELDRIGKYIIHSKKEHSSVNLLFVCTHNSRRSVLAQVWMKTAAHYFGLDFINTFSGGTEKTEANIRTISSLQGSGFIVKKDGNESSNPQYKLSYGDDADIQILFSKKISDYPNPERGFAAIMVCSDADEACPFVPGADIRISLPYLDPKHADDTPLERQAYGQASNSIAKEMFYIVSSIKNI